MILIAGTLLVLAKPLPQAGQGSTQGKGVATTLDQDEYKNCRSRCVAQTFSSAAWEAEQACKKRCKESKTGAQG